MIRPVFIEDESLFYLFAFRIKVKENRPMIGANIIQVINYTIKKEKDPVWCG